MGWAWSQGTVHDELEGVVPSQLPVTQPSGRYGACSIVLYPSPTKQGEASVFLTWRIHGRGLEATLAPGSYDHGAMAPLWPALLPTLTVSRTALTHKFIILGRGLSLSDVADPRERSRGYPGSWQL